MGSLSRSQLIVYGAVAVVLLLVGARWIRSGDAQGEPAGEVSYADSSATSGFSADQTGSLAVDAEGGTDVVVDVSGAVSDPGVYRLPAGSRVDDALQRAGGATGRAEVDTINLAARLTDGQQIIVPVRVKGSVGVTAGTTAGSAATTESPINVGTATVEELDTIEGIGPVTAQKIMEFRDQQGGISSVDQLDEIDGIGPATMEALRSRLQP
ncbi:MAG TPA: ComEA family DNA-binding protein [Solirubrobacterales bacterium]|nr:ComEA family DNA-binding protein [Solirubrobacterales bacterium]